MFIKIYALRYSPSLNRIVFTFFTGDIFVSGNYKVRNLVS